jgi:hypothetical protein
MDPRIIALITFIVGIAICMAGFKIQKLVITLAWFAIGFSLAGRVCGSFIEAQNILLIVQLVIGIILGSLGYKLEKLALAIAIGYLTYGAIGPYITMFDGNMATAVQIGISILVGILSTLFIKPIVVFVTSVAGASLIKKAIPVFITLDPTILTIIFIGFAVIGVFTQLKSA